MELAIFYEKFGLEILKSRMGRAAEGAKLAQGIGKLEREGRKNTGEQREQIKDEANLF